MFLVLCRHATSSEGGRTVPYSILSQWIWIRGGLRYLYPPGERREERDAAGAHGLAALCVATHVQRRQGPGGDSSAVGEPVGRESVRKARVRSISTQFRWGWCCSPVTETSHRIGRTERKHGPGRTGRTGRSCDVHGSVDHFECRKREETPDGTKTPVLLFFLCVRSDSQSNVFELLYKSYH